MSEANIKQAVPLKMDKAESVLVGIELGGEIVTAGSLLITRRVSAEADRSVGVFRYSQAYLRSHVAVPVDPVHLPLRDGAVEFSCFGGLAPALRDSAPDSWGRTVVQQLMRARGIVSPVGEVDYLLTAPMDRTSNLHFAKRFTGQGQPDWNHLAIRTPDLKLLEELHLYVARALKAARQPDAAVVAPPDQLIKLMSGCGGARPKVTLRARDGVWMVKLLDAQADQLSVPRVESGCLSLARLCGIDSARARAEHVGGQDLLLVKRFDYDEEGRKRQMVSAMTVLSASEDPFRRRNWSYPLLALELNKWSADPAADKLALFRCMVLRAMLSDRDDHPRNYALYRVGTSPGDSYGQWRLTPMYDCVVGLGRGELAETLLMDIGVRGGEISRENILSRIDAFGLSYEQALAEIGYIEEVVMTQWRRVFDQCGVSDVDAQLCSGAIAPLDERSAETFEQRLNRRMGLRG